MPAKKKARKARPLVIGYLERVSSKVFSDYPRQVADLVGKQHGIYALYKGDRLYYAGLATNLRRRLEQHLKDKHSGKWDRFSLFLVRKVDHIKELETLILHVADPKGNKTKGRFGKADNLRPELRKGVRKVMDEEERALFWPRRSRTSKKKGGKTPKASRNKGMEELSKIAHKSFSIRREFKGKLYRARVLTSGRIRLDGELYDSPSAAAQAVRGRATNGWAFWRAKNKKGEWVRLGTLRS